MSAARVSGVLATTVLAILFAVTLFRSVGHETLVAPSNGVNAGRLEDNPAGLKGMGELQGRTRLQQWPGPRAAKGIDAQPPGGRPSLALGEAQKSGQALTREWLADKGAKQDILNEPRYRHGRSTLPAAETAVLVQPQGRTWRRMRNDQVAYGGAFYVFGISLMIAAFLAWRGRIPLREGESGQTIERFTAFERANHWLVAGSFALLALSGIVVLYGDALIRPWLGASLFADLAAASAWSHMMFAVPFVVGLIVMIALWTRQNLPQRLDWEWLKRGGGFLADGQPNPPARKFNAGQKIVFWGVALGGLMVAASGVALMFPFYWSGYAGMQIVQIVHAAVALLMIGLIIGHIYIGSIGMVGAFDAMWTGLVDRNWAKEHHSLWSEETAQARPGSSGDRVAARGRQHRTGWMSLAGGVGVAIILAAAMGVVYGLVSVSSIERTSNAAVHADLR
jgi:formate dehydrogenase subunit gamma